MARAVSSKIWRMREKHLAMCQSVSPTVDLEEGREGGVECQMCQK